MCVKMKKYSHLKSFTPTLWLTWLTNIRYGLDGKCMFVKIIFLFLYGNDSLKFKTA